MKKIKTYYIKAKVFSEWMWCYNSDFESLGCSVAEMLERTGKVNLDLQDYLDEVGYLETQLIDNWDRDEEGEIGEDFEFDFDSAEFKILYPQKTNHLIPKVGEK